MIENHQWFFVASSKAVKVYVKVFGQKRIKAIHSFSNSLARLKNENLVRHIAGRDRKRVGANEVVGFAKPSRSNPRDQANLQFARLAAAFLEKEHTLGHFEQVIVAAESDFFGKMKGFMSLSVQRSISSWINKNLQNTPIKELEKIFFDNS